MSAVVPPTVDARPTYGLPPRGRTVVDMWPIAVAHVGVALALVSLATAIEPLRHPHDTAWISLPLLVVAIAAFTAAEAGRRSASPTAQSLWGLLGFGAAGYLAVAVGVWADAVGASSPITTAIAGLAAGLLAASMQVRRPATGLVLALGLSSVAFSLGLVGDKDGADRATFAAALLVVSALFFAGAHLGRLTPQIPAAFVGLFTGGVASVVIVAGDVDSGTRLLALAALVVVTAAVAPFGSPAVATLLIPVVGVTVGLSGLWWHTGGWPGIGALAGGLAGILVAYFAERRAGIALRMGVPYALGAPILVAGASQLASQSDADALLAAAGTAVLVAVAASLRRPLLLGFAVIELALIAPNHFVGSSAAARHTSEAVLVVVGILLTLGAARTRRDPHPVRTADLARGELPPTPTRTAGFTASYDEVFNAALTAAAGIGPVQLADRGTGRLLVGGVTVAVWRLAGEPATSVAVFGPDDVASALVDRITRAAG